MCSWKWIVVSYKGAARLFVCEIWQHILLVAFPQMTWFFSGLCGYSISNMWLVLVWLFNEILQRYFWDIKADSLHRRCMWEQSIGHWNSSASIIKDEKPSFKISGSLMKSPKREHVHINIRGENLTVIQAVNTTLACYHHIRLIWPTCMQKVPLCTHPEYTTQNQHLKWGFSLSK